ncbi:hypothetical protein PG993_004790 [Apiospora rasikravindrae]|uniref:Aminotransferase class I/classII large domain-containing protein n=1 Tax=Apiospora rasikravindrae TaxID=990691 RepID=A0ABR1TFM0_9PEZI
MESDGLSVRGTANVNAIWPRINKAATEREEPEDTSCIDLSSSENWLLRGELIVLYKNAIRDNLLDRHLSYPDGFSGDTGLLKALVQFFNTYFRPRIPVAKEHLATAPGAAFCLDALLYNICEADDGLLVLTPCWGGFDWLVGVKTGVQPVFVPCLSFDAIFSSEVVGSLERALASSSRPIRGLLMTNPHNPFGQCYPTHVIQDIIKLCHKKGIHFISDEIYALSSFANPDLGDRAVPFVSALQLDIQGMGCDLSRVHTIWSLSKDFGSSGLRMASTFIPQRHRYSLQGCCVTQGNRRLATGLALASNTQLSSLTAVAAASLLTSPDLPRLIALNSERLSDAYLHMTTMLKNEGLRYIPASMGPFLFVKIAPDAVSWDDEAEVVQSCKKAGVSVSAGRGYHVPGKEPGWARINFAVPPEMLQEAISRLTTALCKQQPNGD